MATKTKAGGDGLALPPVRANPATFDANVHQRADLARIADDLRALNARYAIDPDIEVGVLADGTIRFWCFARYGRAFRLSLREARPGRKPTYQETDEWFEAGPAAEAEVARRNGKAVRR